jgi:hypothetical protein
LDRRHGVAMYRRRFIIACSIRPFHLVCLLVCLQS